MNGKNGGNGKGDNDGKTAMTPAQATSIQSHATKITGPIQGASPHGAQAAAAINVNTGVLPPIGAKK